MLSIVAQALTGQCDRTKEFSVLHHVVSENISEFALTGCQFETFSARRPDSGGQGGRQLTKSMRIDSGAGLILCSEYKTGAKADASTPVEQCVFGG